MTAFTGFAIGSRLLGLHSAVQGAVDWTTQNAKHLLAVVVASVFLAVLVWGWIGHHEAAKWKRADQSSEVARKADNAKWSAAFATERASLHSLESGIATRNEQIRRDGLKYAASARQWQADSASNARKAVTSDTMIEHWRELAKKPGDGTCKAGAELLNGLDGL